MCGGTVVILPTGAKGRRALPLRQTAGQRARHAEADQATPTRPARSHAGRARWACSIGGCRKRGRRAACSLANAP